LCVCPCRAGFWDLYASPAAAAAKKGKEADSSEWVQWVDPADVIKKCAAKGEGQPTPAGEAQGLAAARVMALVLVLGLILPSAQQPQQ
jgi:hypothetical protein